MSYKLRNYAANKDKKAVQRIWMECGWMSDDKNEKESFDIFLTGSKPRIYEYNGSAECLVISTPGKLRYVDRDLDYSAITTVTTSRIARNMGAATTLLADVLGRDAAAGAKASGLGIFEQGFYNRLGYGSGTYENWIGFDPAWLSPLPKPRVPQRIELSSWKAIHQARLKRLKTHGAVDLLPPQISHSEMKWMKNSFCLGYKKGNAVTHCFVAHADNVESGPYHIDWLVYRDYHQLQELIALMAGLGDQVRQIRMREPREVQMQDFLRKPFQLQTITKAGKYEASSKSFAYWQMRILDLRSCVSAMKCSDDLVFDLTIEDPVEPYLPAKSVWKGCGGKYTVLLGSKSSIKKGHSGTATSLTASIGDFTRFWLGVQSAAVLNITGTFDGPASLLAELDRIYHVPKPAPDWDY